jgi:hypothetical protein
MSASADRTSLRGRQVFSYIVEQGLGHTYANIAEDYAIPFLRTLKVDLKLNLE